ncbi:MAG: hypothetical protein AB7P69_21665 [Candidatus Binatia bacterium]
MKNRFGRRYISDTEFLDYAADLDLLVDHPSVHLLEFTEKYGILMPVARVRFPPEIVRRWHKDRYPQESGPYGIEDDTPRLDAATTLHNEIYSSLWSESDIYGERTHLLDDIAPEYAPFIQTTLEKNDFVPWSEFRVVIALRDGKEIGDAGQGTRTCYHYWQIFALASFLRSGATILYDLADPDLFRELRSFKITDASRAKLRTSFNLEARQELKAILEQQTMFDAVGYFEAYRRNALHKHAYNCDSTTERLPLSLSREYRKRERVLARETLQRFKLTSNQVLEFIKFQCDLWVTAKQRGPANVAEEYSRNIESTIDLYQLVSRDSFADVVTKVGKAGGYFKPILKVIFPSWMEEQRDLAERSLKSWIVPSMASLPPPFSVSGQDVVNFCEWIEQHGLLQLYWHFKRLLDIGFADHAIARSAIAAEAVAFANTAEVLANDIMRGRKQVPRGEVLSSKVKFILGNGSPSLVALLEKHGKLTRTKKSTLKTRVAQIDHLKKGGANAPVLRALLKLIVIRNEGSHLGLSGFDRKEIYDLLEAMIRATLILWKSR